jgi:thioredoxin-like negative regulator of GroEL
VLAALRDAYAAVGRWDDAGRVQEAYLLLVQEPTRHADAERRLVGLRYQGALAAADAAGRITALRALLRSHPDFDPAAVSLGDALVETGQPRLAERVWWRAISRGARAGVLDRLERLLAGGPRARRLDTLSRRLVRRHPDDGTVRLYRARQLVRLGRLDEAAEELAHVPAPWNALAAYHALLAEVHVRRGGGDDAVTAFRQALAAGALGGFRCEVCGREADEWHGHCDGCQSWGSYRSSFEPVTVGATGARFPTDAR